MKNKKVAAMLLAGVMGIVNCLPQQIVATAEEIVTEDGVLSSECEAYSYNGHYYGVYIVEGYTWKQAKEYCESAGGYLAVITDAKEQAFVESINQGTNLWLGGYRDDEFNWYWVNGETWEYTNWMEGEPNDSANVVSNENCLTMWPGEWNDINEENIYEQYGFICEWDSADDMVGVEPPVGEKPPVVVEPTAEPEKSEEPIQTAEPEKSEEPMETKEPGDEVQPTEVAAQGTVYGYNGHFYSCYEVTGYTWQQAKSYCESAGGYLAVITDADEQNFIEKINQGYNLWLGGYRDDEFNWYWVNGEVWKYTNWMEGEPNDSSNVVSNENCLTVWPEQWNDINEENIYEQSGFICEWDSEESMTGIDVPATFDGGEDDDVDVEPIPSKIPVDRTEEIIENEDGSVTKVVTETKTLTDGSSEVKQIIENTYTNEVGEVISEKKVTDEKKSTDGECLEKYEYDASVLPEDATWNTSKIEEPTETEQKQLEDAGITESIIYDITPEVSGETVQPENGKVKISLNCGEQWKDKEVAVYDFETGEYLDATVEGELVVFEAEHFSLYAVVQAVDSVMRGDVNKDEKVDLSDAQMTLKAALKIANLSESEVKAADVDNNGKVELSDAQTILKAALKIITL